MKRDMKIQSKNKSQDTNSFINMIFVVGGVDGTLRVFINKTNHAAAAAAMVNGRANSAYDDDDDDSPRRMR